AAGVFRIHWHAHADWAGVGTVPMDALRPDCGGRNRGEVRRRICRRPFERDGMVPVRWFGRPDEHPGLDGADRVECRTGPGSDLAHTLHDDGADGADHHNVHDAGTSRAWYWNVDRTTSPASGSLAARS